MQDGLFIGKGRNLDDDRYCEISRVRLMRVMREPSARMTIKREMPRGRTRERTEIKEYRELIY